MTIFFIASLHRTRLFTEKKYVRLIESFRRVASQYLRQQELPDPASSIGIVFVLIALCWLGLNSWHFIDGLERPLMTAPVESASTAVATTAPKVEEIARLFGANPTNIPTSATNLLLLASLAGHDPSLSRALIESPAGSQFYSPGQLLPGGGRLQSIQVDQVEIQLLGKPHPLLLQPAHPPLLVPLEPRGNVEAERSAFP